MISAWYGSDLYYIFTSMAQFQNKICWLVVWTPLQNISQLGWLFPIYGKKENVPNHQPDFDEIDVGKTVID